MRRSRGASLVELLVAFFISALVVISLYRFLVPGIHLWTAGEQRIQVQQEALLALTRLRQDLEASSSGSLLLFHYQPPRSMPDGTRVLLLLCLASCQDQGQRWVFNQGPQSGEPDWRKFVVYYLDDQGVLRRHEIRPPEAFKKMCLKGTTRIRQDPFEFLEQSRQDAVVARGLAKFQILPPGPGSFIPVAAASFSPPPSYTPVPSDTNWIFRLTKAVRILLELRRASVTPPIVSRLEGVAEVIYDGP